ncbi:MAG TPA: CBS domain-containing protein [Anaerolineae bacterium]
MNCVRDILGNKSTQVWMVGPEASVHQAMELMAEKNIGALPVVADGKVVGMFSERDCARKVVLTGKSARLVTVGEVMSQPVTCVGPEQDLDTCMELMTVRRIRHLPVLAGDKLVGMLSIGDVLKTMINDQKVTIRDLSNFIVGGRS